VFVGGNGLKIEFLGKKVVCLIFRPSPILKNKIKLKAEACELGLVGQHA
jgi:hypothetical protein